MKLTAIFLSGMALTASAKTVSQTITLSARNISLVKAFAEVERQTGFVVVYRVDVIQKMSPITVSVHEEPLASFLTRILNSQRLTFLIENKTISIQKKVEATTSPSLNVKSDPLPAPPVTGVVKDALGNPLPAATITVKGESRSVVSDQDGKFSIDATSGQVLVISHVGFETVEVKVGSDHNISLNMKPAVVTVDEVVVVGYGEQKKATLTGSVVTVKGNEIVKSQAINVSNAMAGQLPGVTVVTSSGEPGKDGSLIRIRGANTLGDNSALIVVDGIPGRSLERIDPNSIETITVLKDASAAIYGSQSANGVILITTKRGKAGKPQLTFTANHGFTQPTRIPKMANSAQYATALNEIDIYSGRSPRYTDEDIAKFSDGSDPWKYPSTDWFSATMKKWAAQDGVNVQVSGGGESMRYFVSLGSRKQETQYKNSPHRFNQYDLRSNLDWNINKYISLGMDLSGRLENNNFPTNALEYENITDIFSLIMYQKPTIPALWPNGLPGPDQVSGFNPVVAVTDQVGYNRTKNYVLNSNFKLNLTVPWIKGMSFTANAGIDQGFLLAKRFTKPWYLYSWDRVSYDANNEPVLSKSIKGVNDPRLLESLRHTQNYLLNGMVNYEKSISGDHYFKFLAGVETIKGKGDFFSGFGRYFVSTALDQLDAAGTQDMRSSGNAYQNARLNYFGRANYNYRGKYLVEFVWRVDGSYIFPEAGRFGFFPGASVGWRVSDEKFWQNNLAFINNFKIRGSYGQTGNDRIAEWQYLTTYQFAPQSQVFDISTIERTLSETVIPNPFVTWEVATQRDIGFDAGFLNGKLSITADYFNYLRSNILWHRNASIPTSTGLTLPSENIGKVGNKGFDFSVGYTDRTSDFRYTITLNAGYQKNRIIFWDEPPGAPEYQKSTGHPMGSQIYYQVVGVYKDQDKIDASPHWPGARPGDPMYKDVNNDGQINMDDMVRNDKTELPTVQGGLGFSMEYKRLTFSVLFQGAAGATRYVNLQDGELGNMLLSDFEGRWTPENTSSNKIRIALDNSYFRTQNIAQRNTYFLHKTDYVRLKNVEIGYTLPEKFTKRAGIAGLRIYASGFNLLTYSPDLKDFDPEVTGAPHNMTYPGSRVINVGLSMNF